MCGKIPKDKWSWQYDECQWCYTKSKKGKNKHKGKGLCLNCYDKKRLLENKEKLNKHYLALYHKEKQNPKKYKIFLEKRRKYRFFKRFLNRKRILKREEDFLDWKCDLCSKNCKIKIPFTDLKNMTDFLNFKKALKRKCSIKN